MKRQKILFVCNGNRYRSSTAQKLYQRNSDLKVRSLGLVLPFNLNMTAYLSLKWSERVFVMEPHQMHYLISRWPKAFETRTINCLHIPNHYAHLDPTLIESLSESLTPYIGSPVEYPSPSYSKKKANKDYRHNALWMEA
ncbi:MAG: hypothetical protein AAGA18_12405 [Verrucomicrobiota bacterium]